MIDLDRVSFAGVGLVRPECVLTTGSHDLFAADWRGGISHLRPDGTQFLYCGESVDLPAGPRPNGIALERDGGRCSAGSLGVLSSLILSRTSRVSERIPMDYAPPVISRNRSKNNRLWRVLTDQLTGTV
jgi:hypothetical protein